MDNPYLSRYLKQSIAQDLDDKMVFIGGPRQVGKTTFALQFLNPPQKSNPAYLNWDVLSHREKIKKAELPANSRVILLDELHKSVTWRNQVKGFYDEYFPDTHFLVTGSARLDYFNRGGESLHGRYHYYRLSPFSLCELNSRPTVDDLQTLLEFGGFPEPLLSGNTRTWRRWQRERVHRVLYEDLTTLERVKEVGLIELLLDALPDRVGSPLSVNSLREDLGVGHATVEHWLTILENLYLIFRVPPFGSPKIRAVKKEQKLYFWDWSQANQEGGARFENLVASQLLKYCHYLTDTEGFEMDLRFIRDTDKREVDFVVLKDKKPQFAVECKTGEKSLTPHIKYFKERTQIPEFYQVHMGAKDYGNPKTTGRALPFTTFCRELGMP